MRVTAMLLAAVAVTACTQEISIPTPVRGIWGADCASPVVRFTETGIHLYADNATYVVQSVTFDGNDLRVKYQSPRGAVSETYFKSGETLRLIRGIYAGVERAWSNNHAMNRCN